MFSRGRIAIAAAYFLLVLSVFVGLSYADPGWAEGGIPLVVVTLPWSIPVLIIGGTISMIPGVGHSMANEAANAFMFVIVCGGLNTVLILGARRVSHSLLSSPRLGLMTAAAVAILIAAAQLVMPSIDRDALERSRPRDVPKEAVHVGGAVGWWQHCTYDPVLDMDDCQIWNRKGVALESGQFVPYDGGNAVNSEELQITDTQSGPDRIELKNGRILIPQAREAEMKRFLDRVTGKRQTR